MKKQKNQDNFLFVRKLRLLKKGMILSFEYKLKHMFRNKPMAKTKILL